MKQENLLGNKGKKVYGKKHNYVEFEHFSKIRPGIMVGDLGNYNLLYILEKDYEDALKVVHTYLENKIKTTDEKDESGKHLFEILLSNWKVPSASDIDGFSIIYKSENEKIEFKEKIKKIIELKNNT